MKVNEGWVQMLYDHKTSPDAPVRLMTPFYNVFPDIGTERPTFGLRKILRAQRAGDGVERPACVRAIPMSISGKHLRLIEWVADDKQTLGFMIIAEREE